MKQQTAPAFSGRKKMVERGTSCPRQTFFGLNQFVRLSLHNPSKHTCMTTLALGLVSQGNTGTRMNDGGFLHDQTIAVQSGNVTTRIGQSNFVNLVGIQPNLALSAFQHRAGQALLQFQRNCG